MSDKKVNLIVTCTKRKALAIPRNFRLGSISGHSLQHRAKLWIQRLSAATEPTTTAEKLYAGDQWQIARSLPSVGQDHGIRVRLWVCSAGYGLIPSDAPLAPYSATFSRSHVDTIYRNCDRGHPEAVETWWRELQKWKGPVPGQPRTISQVAARDRKCPLLVVGSPVYLRAIQSDLTTARERLADPSLLTIISGGTDEFGPLSSNLLPCDARLQFALGGALMSLNVRVARKILSDSRAWPLRYESLAKSFERFLAIQPELIMHERKPLTDAEVREFIRDQLQESPQLKATPMLRRLRDTGFACEQKRFKALFQKYQETSRG